ncbi:hypothetical protein C1645_817534 [Glomus cerebriforme]|uniref:Uncharacterized protein n=1 Tax=Glomus cerebriforme TaxID=658196 RepID=A0A397TBV6_9GLOM|nr:hypothetical protein C1645_817534 [Glomus cerebriforme]
MKVKYFKLSSSKYLAKIWGIINDLNTKNNTLEIKNIFSKLTTKINTKITNELFVCLSEVNSSFTVKLSKNNNKLIAEIAKINLRNASYASKVQKILSMINNVTTRLNNIEAYCNNFGNISSEFTLMKTSIEALQNKIIQYYTIIQRLYHSSNSESSSSQLADSALEENRSHFKRVFNSNKKVGNIIDYAFETVRHEICELIGKKIGKGIVKSFYYSEGDPKFNTIMSIMRCVNDKKITNNLNNNNASSVNNNASNVNNNMSSINNNVSSAYNNVEYSSEKKPPYYGLETELPPNKTAIIDDNNNNNNNNIPKEKPVEDYDVSELVSRFLD